MWLPLLAHSIFASKPVDGLNRRVSADSLLKTYAPDRDTYRLADGEIRLVLEDTPTTDCDRARWLRKQLDGKQNSPNWPRI